MPAHDSPDSKTRAIGVADEPLPLTLRFVLVFGGCILVGWFMMFFLLAARW